MFPKKMSPKSKSLAELVGPWQQPDFDSALIDRVRRAWNSPISGLTNHEVATCLRQSIAVEHLLPVAKARVRLRVDDGSEIDDGELARAIEDAEYRLNREQEHKQLLATRFQADEGMQR